MPVTINGDGSITGFVAQTANIANGAIGTNQLASGAITKSTLPAGTVIQCITDTTSAKVTNQTTNYVDTGLLVTMTPRAANSKFFAICDIHIFIDYGGTGNNNSHGIGYNLYKDGTRFTTSLYDGSVGESAENPYDYYTDGDSRTNLRFQKQGQGTFGSTSAAAFTVKFKGYNGSPLVQMNLTANQTQAQLTVMEIAV